MAESEQYGSILEDSAMILERRDAREEDDLENSGDGLESVAGCNCQSQCSRRLKTSTSGKVTGCPCKGNGLRCGTNCHCGTKNKRCTNMAQETQTEDTVHVVAESDAHSQSVEDMLESLPYDMLLKVAKQGFMSRQLELKDLIMTVQNDSCGHLNTQNPVPVFCVCGHCRNMPTDREMVCCKEKNKCRSKTASFQNICIESDNLATAIRSMADTYVFTATYDNRAMRHAAYRQYVMWQHGHLGRGHRRVIPSCCVWEIRKHFPSPNGQYTGYKD